MVSQVFDIFVQADESLRQTNGGLGIGLTLVQRLTELHRGTVTCHSSGLGQGAEFIVRLNASNKPYAIAASTPPSPSAGGASCRLVIIEDQPDTRNVLAVLLETLGHEVYLAENAATGIECCQRHKP